MKKDSHTMIHKYKKYARMISRHMGNNMTEDVYHQAFALLLECQNVVIQTPLPIPVVLYNMQIMRSDWFEENTLVIGIKAKHKLHKNDTIKLRKYMHKLGVKTGLMINFCKGSKALHFVTTTLTNKSSKCFLLVIYETSIFILTLLYFYVYHFRNIVFSLHFNLFLCAIVVLHVNTDIQNDIQSDYAIPTFYSQEDNEYYDNPMNHSPW